MYLIDSDVLINFLNKGIPIPENILKSSVFISIINYVEVEFGNRNSRIRVDGSLKFKKFLKDTNAEVIDINSVIAEKYLEIRLELEKTGIRLADFDILIASTAICYNLTLVTNNQKHFSKIKDLNINSIYF